MTEALEVTTAPFTREELSLLLYVESVAVEKSGRLNLRAINAQDSRTLDAWKADGFIEYGRIRAADINSDGAMWVKLSEEAWAAASAERRARAVRKWRDRNFKTTDETHQGRGHVATV